MPDDEELEFFNYKDLPDEITELIDSKSEAIFDTIRGVESQWTFVILVLVTADFIYHFAPESKLAHLAESFFISVAKTLEAHLNYNPEQEEDP
jgi:hypothetical protein